MSLWSLVIILVVPWAVRTWQTRRTAQQIAAGTPPSPPTLGDRVAVATLAAYASYAVSRVVLRDFDMFGTLALPLDAPTWKLRKALYEYFAQHALVSSNPELSLDAALPQSGEWAPSNLADSLILLYHHFKFNSDARAAYALYGPRGLLHCEYCNDLQHYMFYALPALIGPYLLAACIWGFCTLPAKRAHWRQTCWMSLAAMGVLEVAVRADFINLRHAVASMGLEYLFRGDLVWVTLSNLRNALVAIVSVCMICFTQTLVVPDDIIANKLMPALHEAHAYTRLMTEPELRKAGHERGSSRPTAAGNGSTQSQPSPSSTAVRSK